MESSTINWGIIGCGDVAEVKSGPAFQKCEHSQLLAVMRRNGALAEDFAKRHNVPLWYDNAEALLQNPDINAVYIATPPSTHLAYAIQSLEAGKDVYLEKPIVRNTEEALLLEAAVRKSNNKLVVAHYRRFLPIYLKVKTLLEQGEIGTVKYADIAFLQPFDFNDKSIWRLNPDTSGGGYFHDMAPHQIDLMIHFFGAHTEAKGIAVNQAKLHDVHDTVNGIINFSNGVQFRGIWSFSMPKYLQEDKCAIYGDKGIIKFSFYEEQLEVIKDDKQETFNFKNPINIQQPLIQETVNYFLGKRDNPCPIEAGVTVTRLMDAFTQT